MLNVFSSLEDLTLKTFNRSSDAKSPFTVLPSDAIVI